MSYKNREDTMFYDLWDLETANMIDYFDTEESVVHAVLHMIEQDEEWVTSYCGLVIHSKDGKVETSVVSNDLIAWARDHQFTSLNGEEYPVLDTLWEDEDVYDLPNRD